MKKCLDQLMLKVLEGECDEALEKLFNVTLPLAVVIFTAVFLIVYQFGYLEYYSVTWKPVPGIVWPVFPH